MNAFLNSVLVDLNELKDDIYKKTEFGKDN